MSKDSNTIFSGMRVVLACVVGALLLCLPIAQGVTGEAMAQRAGDEERAGIVDEADGMGSSDGEAFGVGEAETASDTTADAAADAATDAATDAAITDTAAIVVNGNAISQEQARVLANGKSSSPTNVARFNQEKVLPSGCEILSLSTAMGMRGYFVSPADLANNYIKMGEDLTTDYLGSPYEDGGCLAPCIVNAANAWLAANEASDKAYNLTGTTFDGVVELVNMGYPVLVWTTEELVDPVFLEEGDELDWYFPEHCVAVYKVDENEVKISDSIAGLKSCDRARFAEVYGQCRNMAMAVLPPLDEGMIEA